MKVKPMNENIHTLASRAHLDYVRRSIEELDYEISRYQRMHSFICTDFTAAYDALQHLREIIADFSINCLTTDEPELTEEYDL